MIDETRRDGSFRWFAVQTRYQHEKSISDRLHRADIETFLPVHRAVHRWKNGVRAPVDLPLFPCYLFTRIADEQRVRLLREPGVLSLAASNVSPTPIADEEIAKLRVVANELKAQPHPYLAVGEEVRIIAGPLTGVHGILTRKKHELRVVLSIDFILRSVSVETSEFDIEPVRTRSVACTA